MRHRHVLALAFAAQLAFILIQLTSSGMARAVVAGGFWLATLGILLGLTEQTWWDETAWLAFGAFSAAVVTGVLLSFGVFSDPVGVTVPVAGLILVTALVVLLPEKRPVKKGNPVVAVPHGKTYHKKGCRLVKGKEVIVFRSPDEAREAGLRPCKACLNP